MGSDDPNALRKALSRQAAALRKADRALRDAAALPEDLAGAAFAADDILRTLDAVLGEVASPELAAYRSALQARVQGIMTDASARLAALVAERLGRDAPLVGQLPELRWGLLRLEFRLTGPKREVVIWYGPRVAELARASAAADDIAEAAREARASLDAAPLDPAAFLAELRAAYEAARARRRAEPGVALPLLEVLREITLARQPAAFRADPIRDHFVSYGRMQFSYDLFRAGSHKEVSLGVAAHAQTKRPEDHLWVPTSASGDGTHFATIAIRERPHP
jgi:hypothetical protein